MIAFIADTHDDLAAVDTTLQILDEYDVAQVVHLGDVCLPETLEEFASQYEVHWVTGNGDIPHKEALTDVMTAYGGHAHGYNARLEFGDDRFLCRHGLEHDFSYSRVANDDSIDYVMHGHYHHQERTEVGNPPEHGGVVFNPGDDGVYLYGPENGVFDWVPHGRY